MDLQMLVGCPLFYGVSEGPGILFLRAARLFRPDVESTGRRVRRLQKLLAVLARKNLTLSCQIFHTSAKTILGRLLSNQAVRTGSRSFTIPFDRQQLADYLGVDRSALSAELGRMRREGLLETERSWFFLKTEMETERKAPAGVVRRGRYIAYSFSLVYWISVEEVIKMYQAFSAWS